MYSTATVSVSPCRAIAKHEVFRVQSPFYRPSTNKGYSHPQEARVGIGTTRNKPLKSGLVIV